MRERSSSSSMGSGGADGEGLVGGAKPAVAMVAVEFVFSALQIFIKLALDDGMDVRVLVAYRLMFASAFLCPLAFFIERYEETTTTNHEGVARFIPVWTFWNCYKSELASVCHEADELNDHRHMSQQPHPSIHLHRCNPHQVITDLPRILPHHILYKCIFDLSSNSIHQSISLTITFHRQEIVKLGKASGRAKLAGTLVGLAGAMVVTFYKGPELVFMHRLSRVAKLQHDGHGHGLSSAAATTPATSSAARVVGSFLAITSCFSYAVWLSIQSRVGEAFPCHYSIAALVCLSGAVQSSLLALCFHRDMAHWRLGPNIRLYSSAYAGIVASGFAFPLMSWCLRKRGPLYVAMFGPLIIVFVAVLSSIFLDETLHLGIALGAVLIVAGLYMVLWGKAREAQEKAAGVLPQDEELGKESAAPAADAANGKSVKQNGET
ncbi:hypothetical protein HU200_027220 [Digitaria exilis]|uniref:EamA domain-containing protein n=1 Tax=Digitaria exilis TaxID=1010633 RepID=A0A835ERB8_9POAL|nr:hypothetical protein HU200_027220 [Digitaria exilis]